MKSIISLILVLFAQVLAAQENPTEGAKPIVEEGKMLYRSEMASWLGTDLFLESYEERSNIGGYFSYAMGDRTRCVFFSLEDLPVIIGAIEFDSTFQVETAELDLNERSFSPLERDLFEIRNKALTEIQSDTLFKMYQNTNLNLIPLIWKGEKKVYVLTGPEIGGVVVFGNDYLITFDEGNHLLSKKALHRNLIPIYYGQEHAEGEEPVGAMHSHLPETGSYITATDICTLMLYSKYANWKTHSVVSERYINIWDCETNSLVVVKKDAFEKIEKDQKERKKEKD
ncbi:MAG: hypothetical protein GYB31_18470 [Bacteroidetes bacterium]|nr:hypothetical protein [Bacteroidota bacterium]